MNEQGTPATAGQNETPTGATNGAAPAEQGGTPALDWRTVLEQVDPKELHAIPKIRDYIEGVAGEKAHRKVLLAQEEWKREQEEAKVQQEREKRKRLAREAPLEFAEQFLAEEEKAEAQAELDNLKGTLRKEFGKVIGQSFQDVPEWANFTAEDYAQLVKAVEGKDDYEAIAAYNKTMVNIIATKRAEAIHHDRWEKELAKEREAIRQEEAAKLLKQAPQPDLTKPKGTPAAVNLDAMSPKEFDAWYQRTFLDRL